MKSQTSMITMAGLAWFGLMVILLTSGTSISTQATPAPTHQAASEKTGSSSESSVIIPPYKSYVVTQGPHGQSYGQYAIDLTGGKGASLLSPIGGKVTQN